MTKASHIASNLSYFHESLGAWELWNIFIVISRVLTSNWRQSIPQGWVWCRCDLALSYAPHKSWWRLTCGTLQRNSCQCILLVSQGTWKKENTSRLNLEIMKLESFTTWHTLTQLTLSLWWSFLKRKSMDKTQSRNKIEMGNGKVLGNRKIEK